MLRFDPEADVRLHHDRSVLPALVTVGDRGSSHVALDLESVGSVAVTGDEAMVEAVLRSMLIELGAGSPLSNASVLTVGFSTESSVGLPQVKAVSAGEALREATAVAGQTAGAADEYGSFGLRRSGSTDEAVVVIVAPGGHDGVDELVRVAQPWSGVAVIVTGDTVGTGAVFEVAAGRGELSCPYFVSPLQVTPVQVSHETDSALSIVIDEATVDTDAVSDHDVIEAAELIARTTVLPPASSTLEPFVLDVLDEPAFSAAASDDHQAGESGVVVYDDAVAAGHESTLTHQDDLGDDMVDDPGDVDDTSGVESETEPFGSVDAVASEDVIDIPPIEDATVPIPPGPLVRVMGELACDEFPGLGGIGMRIVVALTAAGERGLSTEQLVDRVWAGRRVQPRTITNQVGKVRREIGVEHLPRRPANHAAVVEGLVLDVEWLKFLVADGALRSSEMERRCLCAGLGLVGGPPFAAAGLDWPDVAIWRQEAEVVIEGAALRLVELALEDDDFEMAKYAIRQGLIGLQVSESLVRARMRVAAAEQDATSVVKLYQDLQAELLRRFDHDEPSRETQELRDELLASLGASKRRPN